MKKYLFLIIIVSIFNLRVNGQNFIYIGENSFPCTETVSLKSNSEPLNDLINDLNISFAKDGTTNIIVVSTKIVSTVRISEKLIIYLDNGTVISCIDRGIKDNVDDIATTAYQLTISELNKMRKSNINTIRYQIKCEECFSNPLVEGNYSASNKDVSKIDFTKIITEFYK